MTKGRLEAFSDAVIAIVMTIMVLELVPPHEATVEALLGLWPIFLAYILSFVHLAIYWNNHHHLLQACRTVRGRVLWMNMLLLFWLSLIPFGTAWMGDTGFAPLPTAAYGVVLLLSAFSYGLLVGALRAVPGQNELLAEALGDDRKGWISPLLYLTAIPIAFFVPAISVGLYATVAAMWLIPDRRIERRIAA
jgi:uncharacterized membrane protein